MPESQIITWIITYKYLIIFPLAVVEGPIISVLCGFLLHFEYFEFWPLLFVLVLGDLVGDVIWYGIGYFGAKPLIRKYGHMVNLTEENMARIERVFRKHQNKTILLSKMSMGLGFALVTLTTAGAIGIPLGSYIFFNFIGGLFWSSLLLAAGYFFGNLYLAIDRGFRIAYLIMVSLLLVAAFVGFKQYVKNRVIEDKL